MHRVETIIDGLVATLAGVLFVAVGVPLLAEPANWKPLGVFFGLGFPAFGLWPIIGGVRLLWSSRDREIRNRLSPGEQLMRWTARLHFLVLTVCLTCCAIGFRNRSNAPLDVAWHLATWVNLLFLGAALALLLAVRVPVPASRLEGRDSEHQPPPHGGGTSHAVDFRLGRSGARSIA